MLIGGRLARELDRAFGAAGFGPLTVVGLPDNVFVSVGLTSQDQSDLDTFEEAVRRVPEVGAGAGLSRRPDGICAPRSRRDRPAGSLRKWVGISHGITLSSR
jgi:hypothetical protein